MVSVGERREQRAPETGELSWAEKTVHENVAWAMVTTAKSTTKALKMTAVLRLAMTMMKREREREGKSTETERQSGADPLKLLQQEEQSHTRNRSTPIKQVEEHKERSVGEGREENEAEGRRGAKHAFPSASHKLKLTSLDSLSAACIYQRLRHQKTATEREDGRQTKSGKEVWLATYRRWDCLLLWQTKTRATAALPNTQKSALRADPRIHSELLWRTTRLFDPAPTQAFHQCRSSPSVPIDAANEPSMEQGERSGGRIERRKREGRGISRCQTRARTHAHTRSGLWPLAEMPVSCTQPRANQYPCRQRCSMDPVASCVW